MRALRVHLSGSVYPSSNDFRRMKEPSCIHQVLDCVLFGTLSFAKRGQKV